jgi:RNA polymerase sigma-70 factor (sigma-E family)
MPDATFDEFVRASLPALGRYAHALTGTAHAGEDLVQDTLVKVSRAWRRIRQDGDPVGYAKVVMFRTHVSLWRATRRHPAPVAMVETATDGGFSAVEARDTLRRVLGTLPRLQRAVLVLGYLDDASDDEIARIIGRKPTTVRSLRKRGLAALRVQLESDAAVDGAPQRQASTTVVGGGHGSR